MLLFLLLAGCGGPPLASEFGSAPESNSAPELEDGCMTGGGAAAEVPDCPVTDGLSYLPPAPPNVMLLVDRSGSMTFRWGGLLQLTPYIEGMGAVTRTGLAVFPGGGDCEETGEVLVPMALASGVDILAALSTTVPEGHTPMVEALQDLRLAGELQDPHRDNAVIVVADGEPNGGRDPDVEMREWASLPEPVDMHFISFASSAEADAVMQGMAEGTPHGFHDSAADITELAARLDRVAASLSPCGYVLDTPVDAVSVSLDGVALEACTDADCVEGFGYDAETGIVTLAPLTCRAAAAVACPDVVIRER